MKAAEEWKFSQLLHGWCLWMWVYSVDALIKWSLAVWHLTAYKLLGNSHHKQAEQSNDFIREFNYGKYFIMHKHLIGLKYDASLRNHLLCYFIIETFLSFHTTRHDTSDANKWLSS